MGRIGEPGLRHESDSLTTTQIFRFWWLSIQKPMRSRLVSFECIGISALWQNLNPRSERRNYRLLR